MVKIHKLKVINAACFLGLVGVFMGLVFGIITAILTFFVPVIGAYKLWMILVGIPLGYGILMFISGLIFMPLINLTLKIVKGLHLEMDLTETTSEKKLAKPTIKPVKKQEVKPIIKHPVKSAKDSSPLSQMTNSKTTQNLAPKIPMKPAI